MQIVDKKIKTIQSLFRRKRKRAKKINPKLKTLEKMRMRTKLIKTKRRKRPSRYVL
jgi:hypothetical protein